MAHDAAFTRSGQRRELGATDAPFTVLPRPGAQDEFAARLLNVLAHDQDAVLALAGTGREIETSAVVCHFEKRFETVAAAKRRNWDGQ